MKVGEKDLHYKIPSLPTTSDHRSMSQTTETLGPIGLDNSLVVPPANGNLSLILESVKKVSFQQKPVVAPGPGQVQVNIRQTGKRYPQGEGTDSH